MNIRQKLTLVLITATTFAFTGCTTQPQYLGGTSTQKTALTMGIDRKDFEKAASLAVESLLRSGALTKRDGTKNKIMMGRMINDTTQRIDTDMLIKKIRIAILNSRQAYIINSMSYGGKSTDSMIFETRKLKNNKEFRQSTIAKTGQLDVANMSLSGKILQRTARTADDKQLVEYWFQLTLTDLIGGYSVWESEEIVEKLGSNQTVTW
ncbi:MAG: penicillin-binding protein activator LpoB [Campylobacterota bacterium]|nr:penicillin-binding protein activator LpoB [Campylobacterota bacterium]